MPRDAVSRTANVERTGRHKWVNVTATVIVHDRVNAEHYTLRTEQSDNSVRMFNWQHTNMWSYLTGSENTYINIYIYIRQVSFFSIHFFPVFILC